MKKKIIAFLIGMVAIFMLIVNFSVLSNSKTGDAILDLVTVTQADAEDGCIAYGDYYQESWCIYCCKCSCAVECCVDIC